MSVRIGIIGAAGRMGISIARCLLDDAVPGLELAVAVDHAEHHDLGEDLGVLAGKGNAGVVISSSLGEAADDADVFIDFSFHTATSAHAELLAAKGKALVIGTTGFTDEEKAVIAQAAQRIPVVMAPNMSLGVNLLFCLAEQAARALKGQGYDVEIVEAHHRRKKDAPSGTALGLGEAVAGGLGVNLADHALHGREGQVGERVEGEIGFHAVRGGDIVGDHTVMFAAEGEIVELGHRATSRDTFAVGALKAASWLKGQPAGSYTMKDVLGLSGE